MQIPKSKGSNWLIQLAPENYYGFLMGSTLFNEKQDSVIFSTRFSV
jgi:hypothetical protein